MKPSTKAVKVASKPLSPDSESIWSLKPADDVHLGDKFIENGNTTKFKSGKKPKLNQVNKGLSKGIGKKKDNNVNKKQADAILSFLLPNESKKEQLKFQDEKKVDENRSTISKLIGSKKNGQVKYSNVLNKVPENNDDMDHYEINIDNKTNKNQDREVPVLEESNKILEQLSKSPSSTFSSSLSSSSKSNVSLSPSSKSSNSSINKPKDISKDIKSRIFNSINNKDIDDITKNKRKNKNKDNLYVNTKLKFEEINKDNDQGSDKETQNKDGENVIINVENQKENDKEINKINIENKYITPTPLPTPINSKKSQIHNTKKEKMNKSNPLNVKDLNKINWNKKEKDKFINLYKDNEDDDEEEEEEKEDLTSKYATIINKYEEQNNKKDIENKNMIPKSSNKINYKIDFKDEDTETDIMDAEYNEDNDKEGNNELKGLQEALNRINGDVDYQNEQKNIIMNLEKMKMINNNISKLLLTKIIRKISKISKIVYKRLIEEPNETEIRITESLNSTEKKSKLFNISMMEMVKDMRIMINQYRKEANKIDLKQTKYKAELNKIKIDYSNKLHHLLNIHETESESLLENKQIKTQTNQFWKFCADIQRKDRDLEEIKANMIQLLDL